MSVRGGHVVWRVRALLLRMRCTVLRRSVLAETWWGGNWQELRDRQAQLARRNSIADGSAAQELRQAIAQLHEELHHMDVHTGVLQDQLWKMRMQGSAARPLGPAETM